MKAFLFFAVNHDYDQTIKDNLKQMSAFEMWDKGLKKFVYVFPLNKLNEVIAITGKTIDLTSPEGEILNLLKHVPTEKATCEMERYKGEGYMHISRFPNFFRLSYPVRKKPCNVEVPTEAVEVLWEIAKTFPIGEAVLTTKYSELWCRKLKLTRFYVDKMKSKEAQKYDVEQFFRESGTFQKHKFFGMRAFYLKFYGAAKVLEYYGCIKHHRHGNIERLSDTWEIDSKLGGNLW